MDYDLSRLSSRSFEQMVQALTMGVFGHGVVVFGDGPDGGREATHYGETTFAPHGEAWTGQTVLQAKFRQRPLRTEIDGPWALDALRGELRKFAERTGDRRPPTNFVFVTNAVLSPGTGGGKDKAIAELEQAKLDWGLVDYDIWDYDKLRTLLDRDEEVRTSFGWITAGDVLAAMLRRLDDTNPDFERTIVNYLEKTLISDRFVRLEEAGHSAEDPTPLSRVFVDLPATRAGGDGSGMFLRDLLEHTAVLSHGGERPPGSTGRVVLVGGPGQGKTTLGQFACQVFRAGLLSSVEGRPLSPEGAEAVKAVEAACLDTGFELGRGPRFPVRVVLTDLAAALTECEQPLLGWIADAISRRVGATVSIELFRRWLGGYPWFLVLDGLDEVPPGAGRDRVMRCIEDFQVDVAQERADVFVLATTRPQGYNDDFSPQRYDHRQLTDLGPEAALDYGSRLARARYGADGDRTATVVERLGRAVHNGATLHLMRSPLQVAIMTALVDRFGQPPHERWSLFHRYYEVIYQRERERDTDAASILSDYQPDIDAIHQRVGLALHVLTTGEEHADPRLTGAELTRIVNARLGEEGHPGAQTAAMAQRIRSAAELRLVFLVGAEEDRIGFEIRSLQEFMAAGALVDGPDEQVIARLRAIAPLPSWRNVLLFAAGECFVRKQHLRSHLLDLCRSLDVDAGDPLFGPLKVGARLALDLLEDRVARRQPAQRRVLAAHALDALDIADPALSIRLARCHDDQLDDLYRARLRDLVTSPDEIRRTNARRCLATLSSDGVTWARSALRDGVPPRNGAEAFALLDELPEEIFDDLDQPYAALCVALLDHDALRALSDDGCLQELFDELVWSGNWQIRPTPVRAGAESLGFSYVDLGALASFTRLDRRGPRLAVDSIPPSPTIAVYRAAEAFANLPTARTLMAVLHQVAESSTPEVWRGCAANVPWPLGVILARSATRQALERAIDEIRRSGAESSSRGDNAWGRVQGDWNDRGIELVRDCIEAAQPFPLEVAEGWRRPYDDTVAVPLLDEFRALRDEGHPGVANLARILLAHATVVAETRPVHAGTLTELLEALGPRSTEVDVAILKGVGASVEELADVLVSMQAATRFTGKKGTVGLSTVAMLMSHVGASPSARAIEALAFAMAGCEQTPDGAMPMGLEHGDPRTCACAAYVALLLDDRTSTARELGRRFAAANDNDGALSALLDSDHAAESEGWDEFLDAYREHAPRTWAEHRWIDRLMREAMSRRPTSLVDRSVWRDLLLFEPHPLALAEERPR